MNRPNTHKTKQDWPAAVESNFMRCTEPLDRDGIIYYNYTQRSFCKLSAVCIRRCNGEYSKGEFRRMALESARVKIACRRNDNHYSATRTFCSLEIWSIGHLLNKSQLHQSIVG
jgi:hypothetical protein